MLRILEKLKSDPNLMVRRSVANNLNDIVKDNPDIVVAALERWQQMDSSKEMQWIISHAQRTLLKRGHPGALRLPGDDPCVQIEVSDIQLSDEQPAIGDEIVFSFTVTFHQHETCKLMNDYVVHFMKANGKQAPKVFKAAKKTIKPGETITMKEAPFLPTTQHAGALLRPTQPGSADQRQRDLTGGFCVGVSSPWQTHS